MAQLLVRGLGEDVKDRLKARAKRHGRSLEAEVREVLTEAARAERQEQGPEEEKLGARLRKKYGSSGLTKEEWDEFEKSMAEERKDWERSALRRGL